MESKSDYWVHEPDIAGLRHAHHLLKIDQATATAQLTGLADRGSAMSMWYLAEFYMNDAPSGHEKALYWYRRADAAGLAEGSFMLGRLLATEGRNQDAIDAFRRGSEKGYAPATYRLAKMHEEGQGVERDARKARVFFEAAAAQGHIFAKRDLALHYLRGTFGERLIGRGLSLMVSVCGDLVRMLFGAAKSGPAIDDKSLG